MASTALLMIWAIVITTSKMATACLSVPLPKRFTGTTRNTFFKPAAFIYIYIYLFIRTTVNTAFTIATA